MKKLAINEQAAEILRIAEESGVQSNYFFRTTFERYQVQLSILEDLEKTLKSEGLLVEKEYIKGSKNLYTHPAIRQYNSTCDSANKTVAVLMKIVKSFAMEESDSGEDELMRIINGGA